MILNDGFKIDTHCDATLANVRLDVIPVLSDNPPLFRTADRAVGDVDNPDTELPVLAA